MSEEFYEHRFRMFSMGSSFTDYPYLLYLWYDYHAEKYDQTLFGTVPDERDKGAVLVREPYSRKLSMQNEKRLSDFIRDVAKSKGIDHEDMDRARQRRFHRTTQSKMEEYEHLMEHSPETFQFINDFIEEQAKRMMMLAKQMGLADFDKINIADFHNTSIKLGEEEK